MAARGGVEAPSRESRGKKVIQHVPSRRATHHPHSTEREAQAGCKARRYHLRAQRARRMDRHAHASTELRIAEADVGRAEWLQLGTAAWRHHPTRPKYNNSKVRSSIFFFFFGKTHNYGSVQKLIRRITPHYMMTVEYSSLKRCNNSNNRLQLLPFICISFHHLTLPCSFFFESKTTRWV